jgi:hypothetical protein
METDDYTTDYYDSDAGDPQLPTKQEERNRKLEELGVDGSDKEASPIIKKLKNIFKILGD